jgi:hypothetical protein
LKVQKPNGKRTIDVRGLIERRPWSVLSWASGIIALAFIGYYGITALGNPSVNIGQQFVLSEFPDPRISPWFFGKPITWFSYASFLYWTFGLEAQKSHFLNFKDRTRRFMFIVTALIGFGALYEIFFNFMLWSALEVLANNCVPPATPPCNPDLLANSFPNLRNPLNLVFATKVVTLVFALSVYSLYFLHRVDKEIDRRNESHPAPLSRRELEELESIRNVSTTRSQTLTASIRERQDIPEYPPSKQVP